MQKVVEKLIELWSKKDFDEEEAIKIANDIRKRWKDEAKDCSIAGLAGIKKAKSSSTEGNASIKKSSRTESEPDSKKAKSSLTESNASTEKE